MSLSQAKQGTGSMIHNEFQSEIRLTETPQQIIEESYEKEQSKMENQESTTLIEQELHESDSKPKLFEGKTPIAKSWWISRIFFFWVNPLMSFT